MNSAEAKAMAWKRIVDFKEAFSICLEGNKYMVKYCPGAPPHDVKPTDKGGV